MEEKTPMEKRRIEKGVTKAFIGAKLGLSRAYITSIFNGHFRMQEDTMLDLAAILDLDVEILRAWNEDKFGTSKPLTGRPRKGRKP